jgi:hypothetical protein
MAGPKLISFAEANKLARRHPLCNDSDQRYSCRAKKISELVLTITFADGASSVDVYARVPGKWAVIDILRGCRDVIYDKNFSAKRPYALQPHPEVAEEEIADILAAAGIHPYRANRRSRTLTALLAGRQRPGGLERHYWEDSLDALSNCGLVTVSVGKDDNRTFEWTPAAWRNLHPEAERALEFFAA